MQRRRSVFFFAPAWHSCGSYEVFKAQVNAARNLGLFTVFCAVSPHPSIDSQALAYWTEYAVRTRDLGADVRVEIAADRMRYLLPAYWLSKAKAAKSTYSYWRCLPASWSALPLSVVQLVNTTHPVAIYCNHYFNIPIAMRLAALAPKARFIVETHDIQSRHHADWGVSHPVSGQSHDFDAMWSDEKAQLSLARHLVHLNDEECHFVRSELPAQDHHLILPSLPRHYREPSFEPAHEPLDLLVVASNNAGNELSVKWLLEEIWGEEMDSRYRLRIAGDVLTGLRRSWPDLVARWKHLFLGIVDETSSLYQAAKVVLLPVRAGHGIAIKTIEALAHGKPVVGSSLAYRGFAKLLPSQLQPDLADAPADFVKAIEAAMQRAAHGPDVRSVLTYETLFSPEAYKSRIASVLGVAQ